MSRAGSVKDYSNVSKEHWRGWAWNQILSRTDGREEALPVLYLLGPDDNDRRVALRKGVPGYNLIGIDRSISNVRSCRSSGGLAIQGSLDDVLASWPSTVGVAAVLADFCCGIEKDNCNLLSYFARSPLRESVLVVNLMRGRDGWSNDLRQEVVDEFGLHIPLARNGLMSSEKNRAVQFLCYQAWTMISRAHEGSHHKLNPLEFKQAVKRMIDEFSWEAMSYRSGNIVFDSVCMNMPSWVIARKFPAVVGGHSGMMLVKTTIRAPDSGDDIIENENGERTAPPEEIRRRISATLAHRTTRMRKEKRR